MKTLEVMEQYLRGKTLSKQTERQIKFVFNSLSKYSEDYPDKGITINAWLSNLKRINDYADTTIRKHYKMGKMVGTYIKKYYDIENPFEKAECPKVAKKKRRYLQANDLLSVIGACKFGYDRELILTLIDSGCRIGGLAGARGKDIYPGEGETGHMILKEKTGERKYRLDTRICFELKKLAGDDNNYVFGDSWGQGAKVSQSEDRVSRLSSRVRRIMQRAGLTGSKLGPHTLRHSSGSLVAKKTLSPLIVKDLLQHDDIDSSMVYIHDAEEGIAQTISPLKLISETAFSEMKLKLKQLPMRTEDGHSDTEMMVAEQEKIESVQNYSEDMFPEINDDIAIRPLLKAEDLRIVRQGFVLLAQDDKYHYEMLKARELMKRILRRTR